MTDVETLAERVRTVERAVTDGGGEFPDAAALADVETRIDELEDRVAAIDDRATELEAATQALRGYVGNVRSVNEDVEQRADAALAATDRLERRLDEELHGQGRSGPGPDRATTGQRGADEASTGPRGLDEVSTRQREPDERPAGQCGPDSFDRRGAVAAGSRSAETRPEPPSGPERVDGDPGGGERCQDTDDRTSLTEGGADHEPDGADEPGVLARIRAYL